MSTLDVVRRNSDRYHIVALAAKRQIDRLFEQCVEFQPALVAVADEDAAERLRRRLQGAGLGQIRLLKGMAGLEEVAAEPGSRCVMAAIVGAAGLLPTLAAARAGKRVLLANKESIVVGGRLLLREVARGGAELLPIDSEHNAVFQCLPENFGSGLDEAGVSSILLTASGGPFRLLSSRALREVTPEQACAHPNWSMGRKISVDSATLMNKGLELIEACHLFGARSEQVEVVVHPQSIVHSLVSYRDGSVLAQLGNPDMRTPIAHALGWPDRVSSGVPAVDLAAIGRLDFEPPDLERFPCLALGRQALEAGGTTTAILNGANEVAVGAFLEGRIIFTDIAGIIEDTLASVAVLPGDTLDEVLESDREARSAADVSIARRNRQVRR